MTSPRKLFFHRAALELTLLVLLLTPVSPSLTTRSALPRTPPRPGYPSPDWPQDDFWNQLQGQDSNHSPEGGLLDALKRIVGHKSLTRNEQLAHDVDKLSEEFRIFLFHQQGVPKLGHTPIGRILQPVYWIPRHRGLHSFGKERLPYHPHRLHNPHNNPHHPHQGLSLGQNGLKDQGREGYYLSPDAVPVRNPLTFYPVNSPNPSSTVPYNNHAYTPNPEEETLSKVIDQLTRNAGINPQTNLIPAGKFPQPPPPPVKPVTYNVPPPSSTHPSRFPAGHVPNKPTTKPSYKDLLKLENTLKQFLFSPNSSAASGKATSQSSPAQSFRHGFSNNVQKATSLPITGQSSGFVAPVRPNDDDERGQSFSGAQDSHFQDSGDLGFGQIVRDRERTGQEDMREEEEEKEKEEQGMEEEMEEENVVPGSSSFSMSFGSFVRDDKDCDSILTKTCEDDAGCQCFGFYQCQKGRCRENARSSAVSFDPDGAGLEGQWHEGPAQVLGRHGKP